jgi:hypothetical protein
MGKAMIVAPLLAIVLIVAGCTAAPEASETPDAAPAVTTEVTTEWTAPADPEAEGPTEAPALPEESAALDAPVTLSTDMVVAIDKISTTTITPETPGEYAGTAVIVTVSVVNDSDQAQSIDSAVISLVTDDGDVGVATTAGPNAPLQGEVAAGATAEGTYVFMLDPAQGRSVKISVNYAAGEPVASFAGQIS